MAQGEGITTAAKGEGAGFGADPALLASLIEPLRVSPLTGDDPGEGVSICPHCGYDLRKDTVIEIGKLRIDPRGIASWDGIGLGLTRSEHTILLSLAKAAPRTLSNDILQERAGSESDSNIVNRWVCFIRQKLEAVHAPRSLIRTRWGHGYSLGEHQ